MAVIRVELFSFRREFDLWLLERFEFTTTGAYSTVFYTMGYESRNVISNIGPINAVFLLVFVSTVL